MKKLIVREIQSPIGAITVVVKETKIIRIEFSTWEEKKEKITHWCKKYGLSTDFAMKKDSLEPLETQLQNYFLGNSQAFSIDYELYGTPFQIKVWRKLAEFVNYGETKTYQDLAIAIGSPRAVRAIGGAMNKNPLSIIVPCHRIIGKNKKMVGYGGGLDKKVYLLNLEQTNDK